MVIALLAVLALLGALTAAAIAAGERRWTQATAQLEAGMAAAQRAPATRRFDPLELQGLPAPVQRYFRAALTPGQPIVTAATLQHEGLFNMGEVQDNWKPFGSRQRIVTSRPGFVWDARIAMAPGLCVHVHDAYVAGAGRLHGAIAGWVTVADLPDTPEPRHAGAPSPARSCAHPGRAAGPACRRKAACASR